MTDNITVSRELLRQVLNAACSPYCAQDLGQLMPAIKAAIEQTAPQTQEKSNDHKLVPLRPPESILAVVRKAYGNATAYDVGHVWHEIYTRLPDAAPVQEPVWLPMDAAPKDGTHVFLLVEFEDHAMEDATGPQLTIGSNTSENDGGPDEWQFAGWNWEHDCYTQGVGNPVGWLPMTVLQLKEHQDTETVRQKVGLT